MESKLKDYLHVRGYSLHISHKKSKKKGTTRRYFYARKWNSQDIYLAPESALHELTEEAVEEKLKKAAGF